MGAWAIAGLCARWQRGRLIAGGIMGVVILELTVIAWGQASYWKNSVDLWTHTVNCTTGNFQAENSLGAALYDQGRMDEALPHFQAAQEINPLYAEAQNNLGGALLVTGKTDDAIAHFKKALEINPRLVEVRNSLGDALYQKGEEQAAIAQYEMALKIAPEYIMARSNLAWLLATSPKDSVRDGQKALQLAREAYAVAGDRNPQVIRTLAAAYAEMGQFSEAEETALRALQVADIQGNARLGALLRSEIALYRAHRPYHHDANARMIAQPSVTPAP
jgi:tetratricopeptide (TPR) repeat protein